MTPEVICYFEALGTSRGAVWDPQNPRTIYGILFVGGERGGRSRPLGGARLHGGAAMRREASRSAVAPRALGLSARRVL